MSILKNVCIFSVGAISGLTIGILLSKKHYSDIVTNEVDKLLESKKCESDNTTKINPIVEPVDNTPENNEERNVTVNNKKAYHEYTKIASEYSGEEKEVNDMDRPYIIDADDCGTLDGYAEIGLTCYADGIITDEFNDEPLSDAVDILGKENIDRFIDSTEDTIYIRNDDTKSDYEVLKDNRNYSESSFNTSREEHDD